MRQWVLSGEFRWPHAPAAAPPAAEALAAVAPSSAPAGDAAFAARHNTRTPFFYNMFPAMWTQEAPVHDCSRRSAAVANSAHAVVAGPEHSAAAAASASVVPAESILNAAAVSPPSTARVPLKLRPRSPSRVQLMEFGSEHARHIRAAEFAAALMSCTPHVSSSNTLPGPGDPMPGANGAIPIADATPINPLAHSAAPGVPILHKGTTRFSKPVADMGDYLGVIRHVRTLRNALQDQWDDPSFQIWIAQTAMAQQQKQQQAAAQQQQQQLQSNSPSWSAPDPTSPHALPAYTPPRSPGGAVVLHVDEADDALLPPPNGNGNGIGNSMLSAPMSPAMRRRRKAQERKSTQRMSWSSFLAARNGVASAAAANAATDASVSNAAMEDVAPVNSEAASGSVRKRDPSENSERCDHKRARLDAQSPLSASSSDGSAPSSVRSAAPASSFRSASAPSSPALSAMSSRAIPLPAAAPRSASLSALISGMVHSHMLPSGKSAESAASAVSPAAGAISGRRLMCLWYRLETDTGARDLLSKLDATGVPPISQLEQHLTRAMQWISSDAQRSGAPPAQLTADHERLLSQYRAHLQERCRNSPPHLQAIGARLQWKQAPASAAAVLS
jgi:hypothetical protein